MQRKKKKMMFGDNHYDQEAYKIFESLNINQDAFKKHSNKDISALNPLDFNKALDDIFNDGAFASKMKLDQKNIKIDKEKPKKSKYRLNTNGIKQTILDEMQKKSYKSFQSKKQNHNSIYGAFNHCDVIWTNKKTGGKVYCGNTTASSDIKVIRQEKLYNIVNCQDITTPNHHESKRKFTYLRFPISSWYWSPFDMDTNEGVLRFFLPVFKFIEQATSKGNNVLIHCLAGAHRAGSTSVAWLMYANKWSVKEAVKHGQKCRDAINPIGSFPELLHKLDDALNEKGLIKQLKKKTNVKKDIQLILKSSKRF